ncbi:MAG: dehydrogenase (quinone) [Acidobacteria bacterium]|jgi:hydrogenase-4 component B|nr:dehydrogenase (quinone) [Acidobacteriota bacterium]
MSDASLLGVAALLVLAGAAVSLALARWRRPAGWVATGFVVAAAVPAWLVVVRTFAGGGWVHPTSVGLPSLGARLNIAVDPLSAFFLAVLATVAPLATLYSVEYMTHYRRDGVAKFYPVLLVFFAATAGVLVVDDFLFFLVFWELMTLSGFFLVVFERDSAVSQRAGLKYFVITHAATLAMVAAALVVWRRTSSFAFADLGRGVDGLLAGQPLIGHLVLFLFALGFATKAGVLPMGDWLPDAHPVAPSGVSAMLSGVLVKLGIYGLLRLLVPFLPVGPAAPVWGAAIALAGTASLFVATLTALRQSDSKRLLAFSTIGQIGYVVLGIGVAVAMLPAHPTVASLALLGALLHVGGHACAKACLFLGAGALLYRTGERDLRRLAGAGAVMPVTAASATTAALSISGVPPLAGFASKWLIIGACLLAGFVAPLYLVLALVALFISLVTLALFVQLLGSVFLAAPAPPRPAAEVPGSMAVPQAVLAGLTVAIGLVPFALLAPLRDAVAVVLPTAVPAAAELAGGPLGLVLRVDGRALAFWAPLVVVAVAVLVALLVHVLARRATAGVREVPVWHCGEEHDLAAVQVPVGGMYLPFKRAFEGIYPRVAVRAPRFPPWLRRVLDLDTWLYGPAARALGRGAAGVARSHVGIPQVYLLWIVIGAVAVVGLLLGLLGTGGAP